jgi:poly(3-hydroxybutyrate) depolymerase
MISTAFSCQLLLVLSLGVSVALGAKPPAGSIPEGSGQYTLPNNGEPLTIFTYRPPTYAHGPLLVVLHGSDRNAEDYRNYAINIAERYNMLVVAPLFDLARFPDERYKRGVGMMKDGKLQPRETWTYNAINRLVADVRAKEKAPDLPYYLLGHSGGGQFIAKMALFFPGGATRFVAANPGSNVFPDQSLPFPYGFGGLPPELTSDEVLRTACAAPLTFFLGTGDIYQNVAIDGFDMSESAMKQGPVRLARNHNYYNLMKKLAARHGWPFNWRLVETPDIGHSGAQMFHAAEIGDALFGPKA